MSAPRPRAPGDAIGRRQLFRGGFLGLAGAIVGVAVPAVYLVLLIADPTGPVENGTALVDSVAAAVVIGGILLLLSFVFYRSAFRALCAADRRFRVPSSLCTIGSLGFLLLIAAAFLLGGSATSLVGCVNGQPARFLTCTDDGASLTGALRLGSELALAGFALAWIGGLGIVTGLAWEGRRLRSPALGSSAGIYALTLLVLAGPVAAIVLTVPGAADAVALLPILAPAAPALVLGATRR